MGKSSSKDPLLRDRRNVAIGILIATGIAALLFWQLFPFRPDTTLLNVSYDASREFYAELNQAFIDEQQQEEDVEVLTTHAASVRQANSLIHGTVADIVSLASRYDVSQALGKPEHLTHQTDKPPLISTISLIVRKGNPQGITDWEDLWDPEIKVALPHPSGSGAGRWAFLALYQHCLETEPNQLLARSKLQALILKADLIDAGARHALRLFQTRPSADALLTWESEALRLYALGFTDLDPVFFSKSIEAALNQALVPRFCERRGTTRAANEYLAFHYTRTAQDIAVRHGLRPTATGHPPTDSGKFPPTVLVDVQTAFPNGQDPWETAFGPEGLLAQFVSLKQAHHGGRE